MIIKNQYMYTIFTKKEKADEFYNFLNNLGVEIYDYPNELDSKYKYYLFHIGYNNENEYNFFQRVSLDAGCIAACKVDLVEKYTLCYIGPHEESDNTARIEYDDIIGVYDSEEEVEVAANNIEEITIGSKQLVVFKSLHNKSFANIKAPICVDFGIIIEEKTEVPC